MITNKVRGFKDIKLGFKGLDSKLKHIAYILYKDEIIEEYSLYNIGVEEYRGKTILTHLLKSTNYFSKEEKVLINEVNLYGVDLE